MKSLLKTTALTLALASSYASAAPTPVINNLTSIYIDANTQMASGLSEGDTGYDDLVTSVFNYFTLADFSPTSTYIDYDDNGVSTGDGVIDTGITHVTALNPLGFGDSFGGFNTLWGLNSDWEFSGFAGLDSVDSTGDTIEDTTVYGGLFTSGEMHFSFNNGTTIEEVMTVSLVSQENGEVSWNSTEGYAESVVTFYTKITDVVEGLFFTNDGIDLYTLFTAGNEINIAAGGEISHLDQTPTLSSAATYAQNGDLENPAEYSRETSLTSFNVSVVPEPTSIAILGLGLLGFAASRKRKAS